MAHPTGPTPHPSAHYEIELRTPFPLSNPATPTEMEDLEEWELLSDDGFPAHEGKPPQVPPVPVGSELVAHKNPDGEFVREIKEIEVASPGTPANREGVSQVLFREPGEVEFEDMRVDAPSKSHLARSGKRLMGGAGGIPYEDKGEKEEEGEGQDLPGQEGGKEKSSEIEEKGCWEGFGFGTLCSMGVAAAATICLLILSGRHQQKHHQQNQQIDFQIRHDEKRMKQVMQQATSLNQAISVVKGVPMSRAHLSFGGHYDVL